MGIEAKGSFGLYAECPHCHHSMRHGFQVCQECGHTVTAEEQKAMQILWLKNLGKFFIMGLVVFSAAFYLLTRT